MIDLIHFFIQMTIQKQICSSVGKVSAFCLCRKVLPIHSAQHFHFSHIRMVPLACCCCLLIIINKLFLLHRKVDMTGEVHNLITEQEFTPGVYRVEFDTKAYWKEEGRTPFHQMADVSRAVMKLLHS